MKNGIKVAGGDRLGKTIIFARSHKHALFIKERFDKQYPQLGGQFCKVIENYEEGENERLIAWPGKRTTVSTADGKGVTVYYDARTGRVFDPGGKIVADTLEEFEVYIAGKTMAEIEAEAKGK